MNVYSTRPEAGFHLPDHLTKGHKKAARFRAALKDSQVANAYLVGTVWIVLRIRPATRYGSAAEFGRRSSR